MKIYLIIILSLFLVLNIYLDKYYKEKFKKENFPPNTIFEIKEDIELPSLSERVAGSKNEEKNYIEKKIYRCYSNFTEMNKFKEVFKKTEELMPGYKQIYFDDIKIEEYIKENFSERIYNAYKNINPDYGAARADLFRYLIIYREGGIYMDVKTGPKKQIDDIFEKNGDKLLVGLGENTIPYYIPKKHLQNFLYLNDDWSFITGVKGSEWQQYIFASPAGNPILGLIIKQVVSNIEEGMKNKQYYNSGKYSVVAMTGPIPFSMVIEKYKKEYKDKIEFFKGGLGRRFDHSLIDYKKIMANKHYSKIENKNILIN